MTVLDVLSCYVSVEVRKDFVLDAVFEAGLFLVDDTEFFGAGLFLVFEFFGFWSDSSSADFDSDTAYSLPLASYTSALPLRAFFYSSLSSFEPPSTF